MKKTLIKLTLIFNVLAIAGCGGGGSDSGGGESSQLGQILLADLVGVYVGLLNLTAQALGVSESDTFEITVTVLDNGTVRFDGDDEDETFTVGISETGSFSGSVVIIEDDCSGTVSVTGTVDGSTASGTVQGDGTCNLNGNEFDVELTGDFSATR